MSRLGPTPVLGLPSVQDIRWTQRLDGSVLPLFSSLTSSQVEPSARFEVVKPATANHRPFFSLTAEQSSLSSMSFSGGADNVVSAGVNLAALTLSYDPAAQGRAGTVLSTHYDVLSNITTGPSGRSPAPGPGTAPASAGLYLRLGSGATAIAGDSRSIGYENWIAIDSFSMGTSLEQGVGGQVSSKPSVAELSWSQSLDGSAPVVLFDLLKGQAIGQATIEQVALDRNGRPVTVMQQALNNVLFSSFNLSIGDPGSASFAGSMNFSSFTQTLWPTLANGSRGGPISYGYDVVRGTAIPGALASHVAGFGNGNLDPSAPPVPVPEPQTWVLLLAGIAGLLGVASRRRAVA
jgi:type VI protein secretion system component Hcp